jgi:3-oxoacyl-[acyl-carrier protein] reductase
MDLGLKDRIAIVAASSEGLGKAVARGLAREGATLALCSRNIGSLNAAAGEIRAATGAEILTQAVDVTAEDQVRDFVARVRDRFGSIDICVTNAGGPPSKTFDQTTAADWRHAVDLNFMSALYFALDVLPAMKERGWGRFITITSITVKQPVDGLILSNAVRASVNGLVKSLSNEYAQYGVLINNVCPGYTATARLRELAAKIGPKAEQQWSSQIPMGRLGQPDEFADLVVFLASERASYITGESIAVDGGFVKGV